MDIAFAKGIMIQWTLPPFQSISFFILMYSNKNGLIIDWYICPLLLNSLLINTGSATIIFPLVSILRSQCFALEFFRVAPNQTVKWFSLNVYRFSNCHFQMVIDIELFDDSLTLKL